MSDDTKVIETEAEEIVATTEVETIVNTEEVNAEESKVAKLEQELNKAKEILEKARKGEKYAKSQRDKAIDLAREELKAEYESKIAELSSKVDSYTAKEKEARLSTLLADAGAVDTKALSKLIGIVDDYDAAVQKAKSDYPALFQPKQLVVPTPNRSTDGLPVTDMATQIKSAAMRGDQKELTRLYALQGIKV